MCTGRLEHTDLVKEKLSEPQSRDPISATECVLVSGHILSRNDFVLGYRTD